MPAVGRPARTRWIVAVILGLCALGVGSGWYAWHASREARARAEIAEARRALDSGRTATARTILRRLAELRPNDAAVLFQLAKLELALGRPDRAEQVFREVPKGTLESDLAAVQVARLAGQRGRLDEAEKLLTDDVLSRLGDRAGEAATVLAGALIRQGRLDEARALYVRHHDQIGRPVFVLQELWKLDNASTATGLEAELQRSKTTYPDDARVTLALAGAALAGGRLAEADSWLRDCEAIRADDPAVARARLTWAVANGDPVSARRALDSLPSDAFPPGRVAELMAWFHRQQEDANCERDDLSRALELGDVRRTRTLDRLAVLAHLAGDEPRVAALRQQQATADLAFQSYSQTLFRPAPERHARDMAAWAQSLGWMFEADLWRGISGESTKLPPLATLGDQLPRLDDLKRRFPTIAPPSAADPRISGASAPIFRDVAKSAGLTFAYDPGSLTPDRTIAQMMGGGVALLDFDGDGWLDVFLPQGGAFPPRVGTPSADALFRNLGDGRFQDVSESAGLRASPGGYSTGATAADFDGDGDADLLVSRWRALLLLRNDGGGFVDATADAGLDGPIDWPTSAAFADLDGDRDLDLYVCQYLDFVPGGPAGKGGPPAGSFNDGNPLTYAPRPDRLYRNDGGRFIDVSESSGVAAADTHGRGLGVVAADLDGDRDLDLFVANDMTANFLFVNEGGLRFEEAGQLAGVAASGDGGFQACMGVAVGDQDGDGEPDLGVTNFMGEGMALYQSAGGGVFADGAAASGLMALTRGVLGFGAAFLDADLDGRLDLAAANGHVNDLRPRSLFAMPQQILMGRPGGRFVEATGDPWNRPRVGRGLAVGDLDHDGRQDVLFVFQNAPVALLRNETPSDGRFLVLELRATSTAPSAEGARVVVHAAGRKQTAWRFAGGSYQSCSDPRLHFGLAGADRVDSVDVFWPSGQADHFTNVPANSAWSLVEGQAEPAPLQGYQNP